MVSTESPRDGDAAGPVAKPLATAARFELCRGLNVTAPAVAETDLPAAETTRQIEIEVTHTHRIHTLAVFLWSAGLLATVLPLEVRGQPAPSPAQNSASADLPTSTTNGTEPISAELPSVESVQTQIEAVTADDSLDETLQSRLLTALRHTLEHLRNLQENSQRQATMTTAIETAAERVALARETLQQPPPEPTLPPEATDPATPLSMEVYHQRRTEAETRLTAVRQELQNLEATRRERLIRASSLPMLIAEARHAVDEAAAVSVGPLHADPQGTLHAARENERLANLAAARQRVSTLLAEQAMIDAEIELLPLQIELASKNVQRAEEELRLWTEALGAQKQSRIQHELAQYRRYLEAVGVDPQRSLALSLGESWIELVSENAATRRSLVRRRSRLDGLDSTFKQAQAEIARDLESPHGLRSGLGLKLQRVRSRLPSPGDLRGEIRAVDESIERSRKLQTTVELTLEDIQGDYAGSMMLRPDLPLPLENGDVEPQEIQLLRQLGADADNHINDLIELKGELELKRRRLDEFRTLIERNVIWMRDAAPLGTSALQSAWLTLRWIVHPTHLHAVGSALALAVLTRGDLVVAWIVCALGPWCFGPRLRRKLREINRGAQLPAENPLVATGWALVITMILAIPTAATLAVLGSLVLHEAGRDAFLQALGESLRLAAAAILPMHWLRQIFRPDGLAELHFRYARELTRPAGVALNQAAWVSVPFVVLWSISSSPSFSQGEDSLGRVVFVIAMALLATILWRLLDPETGVTSKFLREHPNGWSARLHHVWHCFALLPLVFAGLSLAGYTYAATLLTERLYGSLWFLVTLVVIGGTLTRWVQVRRPRHRSIGGDSRGQLLDRRAAAGGPEPTANSVGYAPAEIDAQTLRLFKALLWVTLVVGAAWLWAPVLPAVRFLDGFELWDTTAVDGAVLTITLAHLVTALPIFFLTWVAARNVPGLVESLVLERLPLDKPARYAITSLASYAIAIFGIMLTARAIGLRWEGIQWLVAALGVGLGFGLQEIFANFVSGLILLFEQPIRVGDVVTIGETTGTVSRIRIRATVVTNWDRQELIIPNKNLITERLINWTLSDSTNRIELRIGVAYGTDMPLACRLLEEICHQHENVLVDPKPIITFEKFGDSALHITARCFLGQLDQRLGTTHDLNMTIDRRFKEAGLEIAFPQHDLHIRTLPPGWPRGCSATDCSDDEPSQLKRVEQP